MFTIIICVTTIIIIDILQARSPVISNRYSCNITFRVISSNNLYQNVFFSVIDDITGLSVQNVNYQISTPTSTNSNSIPNPGSNLNMSFQYLGIVIIFRVFLIINWEMCKYFGTLLITSHVNVMVKGCPLQVLHLFRILVYIIYSWLPN